MTTPKSDFSDHLEILKMLNEDSELGEKLRETLEAFSESESGQRLAAKIAFLGLTKQIFDAMLTVMCVSANRFMDRDEIHDEIVLPMGDFVKDITDKALKSEDSLNLHCRYVMLRTRALAEDALGVPRDDGTEKGSETPCPK